MSNKTILIRIRPKTLKQLLQIFPSMKDETMADYFVRLVEELKFN